MKYRVCLVAALLVFALVGPAHADAAADLQKARELVRRLGDSSFRARERATEDLFHLGLTGKTALLEGARADDAEVRRRCRELLPAVLEADRRARVDAFVADREGKQEHHLPGWALFRRLAGNDPAARRLFAAIQRSDAANFLEDIEKAPERAGDLCAGRCQHLQQQMAIPSNGRPHPLTLEEVASVLLVAADPAARLPHPYLVGNLLWQPAVRTAIADRDQAPFRRLVVAWMRRQTDDDTGMQYALQTAANLNLKEGLDVALEALRAHKLKGHVLGMALTTVGKLGSRAQVPVLEPYLADTTLVGNFGLAGGRGTTQLRDVALAMAVHLTGQAHREYGFVFSRNNAALMFHPHFLGFSSDAERDRAHRKWTAWKTAQGRNK